MLNKLFENAARKQLTMNAFDKWSANRTYNKAKKLGCIKTFPNGKEGLDIVKWNAHNMKTQAFIYFVAVPAAGMVGRILAEMDSRN